MYVIDIFPLKSPPLYFPPAGGKPRNTTSSKTVGVFFLAPVGGKMSARRAARRRSG